MEASNHSNGGEISRSLSRRLSCDDVTVAVSAASFCGIEDADRDGMSHHAVGGLRRAEQNQICKVLLPKG